MQGTFHTNSTSNNTRKHPRLDTAVAAVPGGVDWRNVNLEEIDEGKLEDSSDLSYIKMPPQNFRIDNFRFFLDERNDTENVRELNDLLDQEVKAKGKNACVWKVPIKVQKENETIKISPSLTSVQKKITELERINELDTEDEACIVNLLKQMFL